MKLAQRHLQVIKNQLVKLNVYVKKQKQLLVSQSNLAVCVWRFVEKHDFCG